MQQERSFLQRAPQMAWRNHKAISESAACGCYQCCAVISTQDITEWTDWGYTAVCPKCGCDCLIAQSFSVPLDEPTLKAIHDYWFKK